MRLAPGLVLLIVVASSAAAQTADSLPPIDTDRPDLTDGTGTLARGHLQLESGFTSQTSRDQLTSYSGPELLVRIGVLSRAEFRISQTYRSIEISPGRRVSGFDDVQIGTKVRLIDRPSYSVSGELFTTFATGAAGVSTGQVLPGAAFLFQLPPIGRLSMGAEFEMARGMTAVSNYSDFVSISVQYQATRKLQAYGEWYQLQPNGSSTSNQPYLDSGVLFLLSNDVQVDARFGAGLNQSADRYFAGFGFAVRR